MQLALWLTSAARGLYLRSLGLQSVAPGAGGAPVVDATFDRPCLARCLYAPS